jgi:hypothetical protein
MVVIVVGFRTLKRYVHWEYVCVCVRLVQQIYRGGIERCLLQHDSCACASYALLAPLLA